MELKEFLVKSAIGVIFTATAVAVGVVVGGYLAKGIAKAITAVKAKKE